MSSLKLSLVLVLFLSLSTIGYSFDVNNYLYHNESISSISYQNFSSNGNAYSLISISGSPTFLLQNGQLVNSSSDISNILNDYYHKNYYLNDEDVSALRALIKKFNDSRNNGYDTKGKEEYTCRNDVLLSDGKLKFGGVPLRCTDATSCRRVSELLFAVYGDGLGLGSPIVLYTPLMNFALPSFEMDGILLNYSTLLDHLTPDNAVSTLTYIANNTGVLKSDSLKIETTVFRTPRLNDTADRAACNLKCYALCPSLSLDRSALDSLRNLSQSLLTKVSPLGSLQSTTSSISTNTNTRLSFFISETLASDYLKRFSSSNSSGEIAISQGERALSVASSSNLSSNLNSLKALKSNIVNSISSRNFTNLNYSLLQYSSLSVIVSSEANDLLSHYTSALDAKSSATTSLLVLSSKDLDSSSASNLKNLQTRASLLDSRFRSGLGASDLDSLKANYTDIAKQAAMLILSDDGAPASKVVSTFRGMIKSFNFGFSNLATSTKLTTTKDVQSNSTAVFGGLSLLTFLSLSCLVLLVFLYVLVNAKTNIAGLKPVLMVSFATAIIFVFVFSFFTFLFLDKTANSSTLSEFLSDFKGKTTTSVVVDLRSNPISDSQSIVDCGNRLSQSLKAMNRSTTTYVLLPGGCNFVSATGSNSSTTLSNCISSIANQPSAFILYGSVQTQKPQFSTLYQSRAYISANTDYYKSCPMASLFG